MARILIGHAFFMALDDKQLDRGKPYTPLGTLYAAAVVRGLGHEVSLFDAMLAPGVGAFAKVLKDTDPDAVVLFEDSFNFLSKMCLDRMRQAGLDMVARTAEVGVPVLVAGSDATDEPGPYLAAGARAVMLGEAEHTLAKALPAVLDDGAALREVVGLALADGDQVTHTGRREPEREPDRLPWPARDLVDMEAYARVWRRRHGRFSLNMVTTRGCPFHCNWCAKPIWGQRYAMREPEAVAQELEDVVRRYAPDHIWFADDIFGLRPQWTAAFGEAVARRGVRVPFQIQSRVDLMTPEAVAGLQSAGCEEVWMGVESGSQSVLDAMDKGLNVDDVAPAVARLRAAGIRTGFFLQLGYPGEEWEDVLATRDLVRACQPDAIGVSVSYPLPGTAFYDRVADSLGPKRHWNTSGDLAMMFRGTYEPSVYRELYQLLHADHEAFVSESSADAAVREMAPAWTALARSAEHRRASQPTVLPVRTASPSPDLSRSAN